MKVTKTRDVSLEFTTDQYQRIKAMTDFHGIAVATYLRKARTADDTDYRDAMANLKTSRGEPVSSNDIRQRLGLE